MLGLSVSVILKVKPLLMPNPDAYLSTFTTTSFINPVTLLELMMSPSLVAENITFLESLGLGEVFINVKNQAAPLPFGAISTPLHEAIAELDAKKKLAIVNALII